jgi:ADP-ribose pyrophosphatase
LATERFDHEDVEILGEETHYDGFWRLKVIELRHRRFAGGWSEVLRREIHFRGEAVGVLLYDPELDAVGLVEQFRVGALGRAGSPWLFELVAGLVEAGETPEQVAVRETREEAGCELRALAPVAEYFSSPGGSDEYFHIFCGCAKLRDAEALHGVEGEHEDIRLHVIPWERALERLNEGLFNNAHTLLAMQWLREHREEVRRAWR